MVYPFALRALPLRFRRHRGATRAPKFRLVLPANALFGILRYILGVTMICPWCRSVNCFRSHRDGIFDFLSSLTGLRPWRCHGCDRRFHAWRVAASLERYAHCPRCGNFDLEHISRERVEAGTFIFLKRWLRFPAYRCDPCRHRFFSVLQFRRILPAMVESPQGHQTHSAAN
jgi:phage FluMu protein Com